MRVRVRERGQEGIGLTEKCGYSREREKKKKKKKREEREEKRMNGRLFWELMGSFTPPEPVRAWHCWVPGWSAL